MHLDLQNIYKQLFQKAIQTLQYDAVHWKNKATAK